MEPLLRGASKLASLEKEFREEKAAALARIAAVLDRTLADLAALPRRLPTGEEERRRLLEAHAELRERALRYCWYLEVQREAVGFCRHDEIFEAYPVPGPLRA